MQTDRIKLKSLQKKLMPVEDVIAFFRDGDTVGASGFTKAGDSKVVLPALAAHNKHLEGPIKINLITGASLGNDTDGQMVEARLIRKRMPFQVDRVMRQAINRGEVLFVDQNLGETSEMLLDHHIPDIDVAVVEAAFITEDGKLVPTTSVGNSPIFLQQAKKIIIEINEAVSEKVLGLHDVYLPEAFPDRTPIDIRKTEDRIGQPYIDIEPDKVVAIVLSHQQDSPAEVAEPDQKTTAIAQHLIEFFENEVHEGRLSRSLRPLQAGIGKIANAVLKGLGRGDFENLTMYSEVLQDSTFDLIDLDKLAYASAASITVSESCYQRIFENLDRYRDKIILRPQSISNSPEVIRRLGVIGINTAIEFDIYGNVNSSHLSGSQMMNGIGGSGDFARNAHISIFVTPSVSKENRISHVVPMVTHVDHNEHNVDVVVTEQGFADLRGLPPRERAEKIINSCVHPDYKEQLLDYYQRALKEVGGQTPHLLHEAFAWHTRLSKSGSMKS